MKKILTLSLALLFAFASFTYAGQTATRAEFKELINVLKGRWIGDMTLLTDYVAFGKKGEKITAYIDWDIKADGDALLGAFYGGGGMGVHLIYYDAGPKQIRWIMVNSGGSTQANVFYKKKGKWHYSGTGSFVDGRAAKEDYEVILSDNGGQWQVKGVTTIDGAKTEEMSDVWRRVAK